jgi:hypothetical protein
VDVFAKTFRKKSGDIHFSQTFPQLYCSYEKVFYHAVLKDLNKVMSQLMKNASTVRLNVFLNNEEYVSKILSFYYNSNKHF